VRLEWVRLSQHLFVHSNSCPYAGGWIAAITEFEWNHYFADVQQKGPFKRWHHRHEFLPQARNARSGTLVRDIIEYEVGFGLLGALADSLLIEGQMRRAFAECQKILPALLS
jgi:ligand-binding SRPBCC domain-containing protein